MIYLLAFMLLSPFIVTAAMLCVAVKWHKEWVRNWTTITLSGGAHSLPKGYDLTIINSDGLKEIVKIEEVIDDFRIRVGEPRFFIANPDWVARVEKVGE